MPYKTGKFKGELTTRELRMLIAQHNKLMSIKIPAGTKREGILKIINNTGYVVNHKEQKLVPKTRSTAVYKQIPVVKLSEAPAPVKRDRKAEKIKKNIKEKALVEKVLKARGKSSTPSTTSNGTTKEDMAKKIREVLKARGESSTTSNGTTKEDMAKKIREMLKGNVNGALDKEIAELHKISDELEKKKEKKDKPREAKTMWEKRGIFKSKSMDDARLKKKKLSEELIKLNPKFNEYSNKTHSGILKTADSYIKIYEKLATTPEMKRLLKLFWKSQKIWNDEGAIFGDKTKAWKKANK